MKEKRAQGGEDADMMDVDGYGVRSRDHSAKRRLRRGMERRMVG